MTDTAASADDLLQLATDAGEREFAQEALAFLHRESRRRSNAADQWGVGPENLSLFHESTDEVEQLEAQRAREWQRRRWDAGFGWIIGPAEHGGRELPIAYDRLYRLLEAEFDVPDMSPLRIGLGTISPTLTAYCAPDVIAEYVVGLHRGDLIGCQLFSEPEAGSDLAGVRTRAVRDGESWVINGQKVWTSNGAFADVGLALTRTDPDAPKHRGLTMFLVPMSTAGVEVRRLRQMTGGSSFAETFLDDVTVPDRLRVGPEGEGWKITNRTLAGERRATGDRSHESNARAFSLLSELALQLGTATDPLIRDRFVRLYANLRMARWQQQRMQATPEAKLTGAERAIDKLLVAGNLRDIGALAAELLGPAFSADTGEWGTFAWNKWAMGALGYRIAGGTEEIIKTMIAERVLGLPRETRA